MENRLDPRLHFVTVTGIVVRRGADGIPRFLIAKRAPTEKAFPDKWTVPGGKLVRSEYEALPSHTDFGQWYGVVGWVLKKEIAEEARTYDRIAGIPGEIAEVAKLLG